MKRFEGILFISDIDGTLLRNDKSISAENLKAIEYFKSHGGIFTLITGRVPIGAVDIVNTVKPNAPCGCINGGGIYDFKTEKYLFTVEISPSALELVEYVDEKFPSVGIEVHTHEKIYFCKTNAATERHRNNENLPFLQCHYKNIKEPVAKILFAVEDEITMLKLIELLDAHPISENFDFIRSDTEYYEILPKGINKGILVEKLSDILGIDKQKIIAVGDNDNDVSMLRTAHIGIAVSNASDKAKKAADYITVSNEEDAVAKIIYELDKGIKYKDGYVL